MIKIKMNVQTMYYGELLREGREYEIEKSTAEKWIASKLAERVVDEEEK